MPDNRSNEAPSDDPAPPPSETSAPGDTDSADELPAAKTGEKERKGRRLDTTRHMVWLVASMLVLVLSLVLSVRGPEQVVVPGVGAPLPGSCMFRQLTGVGCPGCGLTRCFISLAHGRLLEAWDFNPAGPIIFLIVAMQIPFRSYNLWRLFQGRPSWEPRNALNWILLIGAVVLLGQWVVRLVLGTVA